jgi:S-adenosylmethionine hydrolase
MIFVFSDFGVNGPYSGTMRSVVMRHAPNVAICDLMCDAPDRNPKAASYLLAALTREFQIGDVVLAVVDPGVGSTRQGIVVKADDVSYVGPDNGLFEMVIRRANKVSIKVIDWMPDDASASFHGRDIFGPVAAWLATGQAFASHPIAPDTRFGPAQEWPDELAEVIYVDPYGNLMTGLSARSGDEKIEINAHIVSGARTFSDVPQGSAFHYRNSIGLCEVAVNCGRADKVMGVVIGSTVNVS